MSKALRASVLLLLLTSSAHAGWMPNGSPEPPPPTPPSSLVQEEQMADGYIQNGGPDSLTATVLTMIESVLTLF